MRKYVCPTPYDACGGSLARLGPSGLRACKCHATPQEAFKCYKRYLVSQGYTPINNRDMRAPEGSGLPTIVLTKPSHFGAPLRQGKSSEEKGGKTNNTTPLEGRGFTLSE